MKPQTPAKYTKHVLRLVLVMHNRFILHLVSLQSTSMHIYVCALVRVLRNGKNLIRHEWVLLTNKNSSTT